MLQDWIREFITSIFLQEILTLWKL